MNIKTAAHDPPQSSAYTPATLNDFLVVMLEKYSALLTSEYGKQFDQVRGCGGYPQELLSLRICRSSRMKIGNRCMSNLTSIGKLSSTLFGYRLTKRRSWEGELYP
jgi:hypothetical protein